MKKHFLVVIFLLIILIPAVKSLFIPGGFTSHDLLHHVVRQYAMHEILREGQFPPRWSANLNMGWGYPVFIFLYPLPALLGELFVISGFGFVNAVKAVLFISMAASIIGMYLFLYSFLSKKLPAFVGSVFYLYAPVRFLNIYVSAAAGSALALGVLPFLFLSISELANKPRELKWVVFGSVSFAALVLSHNSTAVMFLPLVISFVFLLKIIRKTSLQYIKSAALVLLLGLGLSAFFWLPAVAEKQFIRYDEIMGTFYQDHFPTLKQLIRSPWGYGLSKPGHDDGLSFQIGLAHIFVVMIAIVNLLLGKLKKDLKYFSVFFLIVFLISVFLMLETSLPLWRNFPLLAYVQFPARFLAAAVFSTSILVALIIYGFRYKHLLSIFLLTLVLYANRNHLRINQVFNEPIDVYLALSPTSTSFSEHLPIWADYPKEKSSVKLSLLSGSGEIKISESKSDKVVAQVKANEDVTISFNQLYFPGWNIYVNGARHDFEFENEMGVPVFRLGKGSYNVSAFFEKTYVRKIADYISLLSLLVIFFLVAGGCVFRKRYLQQSGGQVFGSREMSYLKKPFYHPH